MVKSEYRYRMLHTMLRVKDLTKSISFYTEILGMQLLRKQELSDEKFNMAFVGNAAETTNTVIELTHNWDKSDTFNLGERNGQIV